MVAVATGVVNKQANQLGGAVPHAQGEPLMSLLLSCAWYC